MINPETRVNELERSGELDHTRQRDWFDPTQHPFAKVVMVGCGGIGSATALTLTKIGIPAMTLIDFDSVEAHNVPNQFFAMAHAKKGTTKVDALAQMCEMFGGSKIRAVNGKLQESKDELDSIVVSGLDSMAARSDLWDLVKLNPGVERLIDGRLAGQDIILFCIDPRDPHDIKYYEKTAMFTDEEGLELPCTGRGVFDVSNMVAGLIGRQVRRVITGLEVERVTCLNHETLSLMKG